METLPFAHSSGRGGATGSGSGTGGVSGLSSHGYSGLPFSSSGSAAAGWPHTASASASGQSGGASVSGGAGGHHASSDAAHARAVAGPPPPRRPRELEGFRRVRELSDLRPDVEKASIGKGRRADPAGEFVSPLKALTAYLHHTYHLVNPSFFYELSFNPRRVLTSPPKPMHNDGHDNAESDYILYVNDWLGTEEGNKYLILDTLGKGTFGQVVKCQNMRTHEIVAVKVIKNKPEYFQQSWMEVTILEMLNNNWDPKDEHHILRLHDTFIHAKHLCLVFELLSSNLYELIKQNSFRGLSTSLVRVFTAQLLDALSILHDARIIHCDLKPENILLKTLQTPSIKLVDFGSACHEKQTVYSYIQSRFYRSPEVLLGLPYNAAIDMWSLGCIAAELFLGLPIFPGTSEFNQITRIVEMLGNPPRYMLDAGKQTPEFFNIYSDEFGRKCYRVKSLDQWIREHPNQHEPEQPSKKYFQATTLPDIIRTYPGSRKAGKHPDPAKANRTSFIDFVSGLLNMDPLERWTPQQAKLHPFITGDKFTKPFV
ncbi:kinase-like protein, partial [Tilletiaria anomala UBC 951]